MQEKGGRGSRAEGKKGGKELREGVVEGVGGCPPTGRAGSRLQFTRGAAMVRSLACGIRAI